MFGPIFLQYNFDKLHFALKKKKRMSRWSQSHLITESSEN